MSGNPGCCLFHPQLPGEPRKRLFDRVVYVGSALAAPACRAQDHSTPGFQLRMSSHPDPRLKHPAAGRPPQEAGAPQLCARFQRGQKYKVTRNTGTKPSVASENKHTRTLNVTRLVCSLLGADSRAKSTAAGRWSTSSTARKPAAGRLADVANRLLRSGRAGGRRGAWAGCTPLTLSQPGAGEGPECWDTRHCRRLPGEHPLPGHEILSPLHCTP